MDDSSAIGAARPQHDQLPTQTGSEFDEICHQHYVCVLFHNTNQSGLGRTDTHHTHHTLSHTRHIKSLRSAHSAKTCGGCRTKMIIIIIIFNVRPVRMYYKKHQARTQENINGPQKKTALVLWQTRAHAGVRHAAKEMCVYIYSEYMVNRLRVNSNNFLEVC